MLREEYLRRLVDESYIELYLSSVDGARIYWPWRMQIPKDASTKYRNACEKYIIDSDFADEGVTNEDVLDCAFRVNAEVATLADVYQDCEQTIDAVLNGAELYEDHPFDGELLIPLQRPYVECYESVKDCGTYFGLGGIKDESLAKKLELIREFRDAVGPDPHLHGFGMGVSRQLAVQLHRNPEFIDSVDYTTPIQTSITNVASGKDRMTVVATRALAKLVEDLRLVTPNVEIDPDVPTETENDQQVLGGFE